MPTVNKLTVHEYPSNNELEIKCCNNLKYLVVIFDKKLKWNIHTNYLNSKITKIIFFKQLKTLLLLPSLINIVMQ